MNKILFYMIEQTLISMLKCNSGNILRIDDDHLIVFDDFCIDRTRTVESSHMRGSTRSV